MIVFIVSGFYVFVLAALLFFPVLCALLAQRWGFGWPVGLLTGFLWGPFGIVALWSADRLR